MAREPFPDLQADHATGVADLLRRELDARGLSQAELARRTELSTKHVNQLLQGNSALTADVATRLERVLGLSAEMLARHDGRARAVSARAASVRELEQEADWLDALPVKELHKHGVLQRGQRGGSAVYAVLQFFGVATPQAYAARWLQPAGAGDFKKQSSANPHALALWLRLVERAAESALGADLAPFDPHAISDYATKKLRGLTLRPFPSAVATLQAILREAGVLVLLVPPVTGAKVSGAVRWVGGRPVVALTPLYQYADSFWFAAAHECGHLVLHPRHEETYDSKQVSGDTREQEANAFAAQALLPDVSDLDLYRITGVQAARTLAKEVGVHPSHVAGSHATTTGDYGRLAKLRTGHHVDTGAFTWPGPAGRG